MAISVSSEMKGTEWLIAGENKTRRARKNGKTSMKYLDIFGIKLAENFR